MKFKTTQKKRKTYSSPRVVVYGDFRSLTQAKGGNNDDGGSKPNTRTTGKKL